MRTRAAFWWSGFIQIHQEPWEHAYVFLPVSLVLRVLVTTRARGCFSLSSGLEAPGLGTRVMPGNGGNILDKVAVSVTIALLHILTRNCTGTQVRGLGLSSEETLSGKLGAVHGMSPHGSTVAELQHGRP